MMHRPAITLPYIYVKMRDGTELSEKASTIDTVAYERAAMKHPNDFGPLERSPATWGMFLAWHVCCKSRGLLPDMTLAEFEQAADEAIAFIPENGDGTVDPTRPVVGPD